jgi:2-phosphoglycolate phosphatase
MMASTRSATRSSAAGRPHRGPQRAVLWDLDGTLLESDLSIRDTMNRVLAERGLGTFTRAELDALIGKPLRDILAQRSPDQAAVEAMAQRYRSVYTESGWVTVLLHPGVEDVVRSLRAEGVRQGVVTSKGQNEAEQLLHDLGLASLFDAVAGDDDVRRLKPDPAPVLAACERLGVPTSDAIMVGDTEFDVRAGRAAGARTVGILWGHGTEASLRRAGADHVVADAKELRSCLDRWLRSPVGRHNA